MTEAGLQREKHGREEGSSTAHPRGTGRGEPPSGSSGRGVPPPVTPPARSPLAAKIALGGASCMTPREATREDVSLNQAAASKAKAKLAAKLEKRKGRFLEERERLIGDRFKKTEETQHQKVAAAVASQQPAGEKKKAALRSPEGGHGGALRGEGAKGSTAKPTSRSSGAGGEPLVSGSSLAEEWKASQEAKRERKAARATGGTGGQLGKLQLAAKGLVN